LPDVDLDLFRELTDAFGVPGSEEDVRHIMRRYLEGMAEVDYDNLGSIIAHRQGAPSGPKIMLAGHMDEIGLMVSFVTEEGFLRFVTLGGWWEHVLLAQRVIVRGSKGDITGIIGSTPPHILPKDQRDKLVKSDRMFIDVGAGGREAVKELGIRPGDPVAPYFPFTVMNNPDLLLAKAWDDRVGCALIIDLFRRLQHEPHPNSIYGVGTVQEEVGLRGARTSVDIVRPDVAFALEVDIAQDTLISRDEEIQVYLGRGPSVVMYDASMVAHRRLRDFVLDVAEAERIPVQLSAMPGGGTDAGAFHVHARGVPSLVISVPTRYIHTHAGVISRADYTRALNLITAVVRRLDADTVADIKRH